MMNMVASQEQEMWVTLGFMRGVFSLNGSGGTFCSPQWIELMMEVIRKASPVHQSSTSTTKSLIQQASINMYYMCSDVCDNTWV